MESGKLYTGGFKKNIRRKFITGLLVVFPLFLTFIIIKFLFGLIGGFLSPLVKKIFVFHGVSLRNSSIDDFVVTTISIILTFAALYFVGAIATNYFGKLIIGFFESILHKTPIIKNIYTSSKKLIEIISPTGKKSFKRMVIVEYPKVGMKAFAFVTGNIKMKDGTELTSVLIPTTPNPTSGFLVYLPEEDIIETDIDIEEGIKLIVSGGILVPAQLELYKNTLTSKTQKE
jgi:uncharacterized membrane protein